MRGKKPRERDSYVLRMEDGTLVEVSREIYLERGIPWYAVLCPWGIGRNGSA